MNCWYGNLTDKHNLVSIKRSVLRISWYYMRIYKLTILSMTNILSTYLTYRNYYLSIDCSWCSLCNQSLRIQRLCQSALGGFTTNFTRNLNCVY
nr:MAG TPA: hypothetical protein [Caudoviricetes sp.]DAW73219.1 MAG TPA: hypothetical protein [Caudoviricetes sp.]DAW73409.1 MAG TPA: hypothetical protein [Caudoviricetes sp.]